MPRPSYAETQQAVLARKAPPMQPLCSSRPEANRNRAFLRFASEYTGSAHLCSRSGWTYPGCRNRIASQIVHLPLIALQRLSPRLIAINHGEEEILWISFWKFGPAATGSQWPAMAS